MRMDKARRDVPTDAEWDELFTRARSVQENLEWFTRFAVQTFPMDDKLYNNARRAKDAFGWTIDNLNKIRMGLQDLGTPEHPRTPGGRQIPIVDPSLCKPCRGEPPMVGAGDGLCTSHAGVYVVGGLEAIRQDLIKAARPADAAAAAAADDDPATEARKIFNGATCPACGAGKAAGNYVCTGCWGQLTNPHKRAICKKYPNDRELNQGRAALLAIGWLKEQSA